MNRNISAFCAALSLFCSLSLGAGNAEQPWICTRACWGARWTPTNPFGTISFLNRAIVHHTASASNYTNTSGLEDSKANVRAIQNYHMDHNGWADIGYHFLVDKYGYIFEGVNNAMSGLPRGAHDAWNANSFGFSLMGYFHTPYNQQPTQSMLNALYDVIAWRMPGSWQPYGWPGTSYGTCGNTIGYVDGHRRVNCSTSCPGDIIYNNYLTSDLNGGAIRDGINSRIVGADWEAKYYSQSYPAVMAPNSTAVMWLEYTNTGQNSWLSWGSNPVRLATSNPRGATGYLYYPPNWVNHDRPTNVDYDTAPGEIGRFSFVGQAPSAPGYYVSYWELVCEMVSWFEGAGDDAWFGIDVAHEGNFIHIEAEDYSRGVHAQNTVDYWDKTTGNTGGEYRSHDVDIRTSPEGGYQVGWTEPGEWLRYWYNANAGTFRWTLRYSNGGAAAQAKITVDGTPVGYLDLPNTGNYDTHASVSTNITIGSSGIKSIGLDVEAGNPDYNWFKLERIEDIVIDNPSAVFSGSWVLGTSATGKYGADYHWASSGSSATATYNAGLPVSGNYTVLVMYPAGGNRASNTPHAVNHAGGSANYAVNQQVNGGVWVTLGTHWFNAGGGQVVISASGANNSVVIADAVRFVLVP